MTTSTTPDLFAALTTDAPMNHSVDAVAQRIGISRRSVERIIRAGFIRATKYGRRVTIADAELRRILSEGVPHIPAKIAT